MAADSTLPGLLLWLLPAAFLLHDAEEVFFLPAWLRRNRNLLVQRFPRCSDRLLPHLAGISRAVFTAMAVEELILLLSVTFYAAFSRVYYPWLALFLAFGMHLLVHIGQWIAVGRYIPVGGTSLAALIYCGWGLNFLINFRLFTLREFVLCGMAGFVAASVNLFLLHAAARVTAGKVECRRTRSSAPDRCGSPHRP